MQHSGDIRFDGSAVWLVACLKCHCWLTCCMLDASIVDASNTQVTFTLMPVLYDLLHASYQSLLMLPILRWLSIWCNAYMTCCCILDASIVDASNTLVTLSLMPVLYDLLLHAYWWAMMNASTYLLIIQNAGRTFYGGFYISYQNFFAAFCTWIDPNILSPFFCILNWFSFL